MALQEASEAYLYLVCLFEGTNLCAELLSGQRASEWPVASVVNALNMSDLMQSDLFRATNIKREDACLNLAHLNMFFFFCHEKYFYLPWLNELIAFNILTDV